MSELPTIWPKNCKLAPKCVKCSSDHTTKSCSIDVDSNNKKLLKCTNCNGNHAASYSKCPCRAEYIKLKQNLSSGRKRDTTVTQTKNKFEKTQQPPRNDRTNFPPLDGRNNTSWFDQFKGPSDNINRSTTRNDSELFTAKELMLIFKELVQSIQRCQSKYDQLEAIAEIAMKYLSSGSP